MRLSIFSSRKMTHQFNLSREVHRILKRLNYQDTQKKESAPGTNITAQYNHLVYLLYNKLIIEKIMSYSIKNGHKTTMRGFYICVGFIYKREGSENMQRQETERGMYEGIPDRKLKEHFLRHHMILLKSLWWW